MIFMAPIYDGRIDRRGVRILDHNGKKTFTQREIFDILAKVRAGDTTIFDPKVEGLLSNRDYGRIDWERGKYPPEHHKVGLLVTDEVIFYPKGAEKHPRPKMGSRLVRFERETVFDTNKARYFPTGRFAVISFDVPDVIVTPDPTCNQTHPAKVRLPEATGFGIVPIDKLRLTYTQFGPITFYTVSSADLTPHEIHVKELETASLTPADPDRDGFPCHRLFSPSNYSLYLALLRSERFGDIGIRSMLNELPDMDVILKSTGHICSVTRGFIGVWPDGNTSDGHRVVGADGSWFSEELGIALVTHDDVY